MTELGRSREIEISAALTAVQARIFAAANASGRRREDVRLICVTKTYPSSDIETLCRLGMIDFAENRESEGARKSQELSKDKIARWHYQGKIQSNKIKSMCAWANVIHSLDEIRHVPFIAKAVPAGEVIEIFIQVSLDKQPGRGGIAAENLPQIAESVLVQPSLKLMGIMAVGPLGEAPEVAFARLGQIHSDFKGKYPMSPFLSAGMSSDFEVAIAYGATHIRVGSSILGSRTPQR